MFFKLVYIANVHSDCTFDNKFSLNFGFMIERQSAVFQDSWFNFSTEQRIVNCFRKHFSNKYL